MATTVADKVVSRLREWGVAQIFGYPGDGINGLIGALRRAGNEPRFVQSRHEEMSAFQAVGYAKFSGRVGVCLATSGPGAIHLLNGLYDAKLDHVPVVAIVGQAARTSLGGSYQQEVDLPTLFKDVAHEYVQLATVPEQFPMLIDRAFRTAEAQQTPTCVIIPADLQEIAYEEPTHAMKMVPSSLGWAPPSARLPARDELSRAAEILNEGSKVAILIGQGCRSAADEVVEVADILGAGIAKALLGKDVLPDDLPFVTGPIGLLGSKPSYDMMMDCDTLLVVGSSFPYSQFLPPYGQARAVQIDVDARMIGLRYPMEVNLVGDALSTLRELIPLLHRKADRGWQDTIRSGVAEWWETLEARAGVAADPINPQALFWALSERLPDHAMIAADSGSAANWFARDLRMRPGMRASVSGTLATMGCGVPYAIGAKYAHSDRPAIAVVGDGAMQMNGMAELITIGRYWRDWADPRLVVIVLNNRDLNQVTWELRAMGGEPEFPASQMLPDVHYADVAKMVGLVGIRVEHPDDIPGALDAAMAADRPCVLDVLTDPSVPTLPPHIDVEQARKLTAAMLKGDPHAGPVLKQALKDKLAEYLPG